MRGDLNYCARCGAALAQQHHVLVCTNITCRRVAYRNPKPCAGVLVERDGQVLLVQRGVEPFKGMWDIPGGFLEEWEHPMECALREVHEETGLQVELMALLGIFVDAYDTADYNTLNIYYRARVLDGKPLAADDANALGWFAPDALPAAIAFPAHEREVLNVWRSAMARDPHPTPDPSMVTFVSPPARRKTQDRISGT